MVNCLSLYRLKPYSRLHNGLLAGRLTNLQMRGLWTFVQPCPHPFHLSSLPSGLDLLATPSSKLSNMEGPSAFSEITNCEHTPWLPARPPTGTTPSAVCVAWVSPCDAKSGVCSSVSQCAYSFWMISKKNEKNCLISILLKLLFPVL